MNESVKGTEENPQGGKTLLPGSAKQESPESAQSGSAKSQPGWPAWVVARLIRIVALTVAWTGAGMGVGLFCGILGVVARAALLHTRLDITAAYRVVAFPGALTVGSVALLWNLVQAVRAGVARGRRRAGGR